MSIKIEQVRLGNDIVDVAIRGNVIDEIAPCIGGVFDTVIDGRGKYLTVPFYTSLAICFLSSLMQKL